MIYRPPPFPLITFRHVSNREPIANVTIRQKPLTLEENEEKQMKKLKTHSYLVKNSGENLYRDVTDRGRHFPHFFYFC